MGIELVVVGPRLVLRAEREGAAGDQDLVGARGGAIGRGGVDDRVSAVGAALQRLEHRLLRLQLVLEHQPEDEPVSDEDVGRVEVDALEHLERALAHVCGVGADGAGLQRRQLRAVLPLAPEGPVDVVMDVRDRRCASRSCGGSRAPRSGRHARAPASGGTRGESCVDQLVVREGASRPSVAVRPRSSARLISMTGRP